MTIGDLTSRWRARLSRRHATASTRASRAATGDDQESRSPRRDEVAVGGVAAPGSSAGIRVRLRRSSDRHGIWAAPPTRTSFIFTSTTSTTSSTSSTSSTSTSTISPTSPSTSPAEKKKKTKKKKTTKKKNPPPECAPLPVALDAPGPPHDSFATAAPLLRPPTDRPPAHGANLSPGNGANIEIPVATRVSMGPRRIWVRRPAASATLVTIHEDDLVDDVRDMILKKYANSLGRNFDAPDVTLRILARDARPEKTLGPEEPMARTLDAYFPGGQTVDEALLIEVPGRRTPRPSPQPPRLYADEMRPTEAGSDYFPPMPAPAVSSPHLPPPLPVPAGGHHAGLAAHSMSIITTGHVPALPSPGSATRRHHRDRPRIGRQHTSSPTALVAGPAGGRPPARPRAHSNASDPAHAPPAAPPRPASPAAPPPELAAPAPRVATPPPRAASPRPRSRQPKRARKPPPPPDPPALPAGMLNGGVPPINVLIVEDNIINLKLLEAFMKRLKVRWQTAMNGRDAVTRWRAGGFHLVLMDIQLPIMSGLDATKEIRRLERLNAIGVFSSSASSSAPETGADEARGEDKLPSTVLFKSPVIIVALTASSLQSDRHEALAAGCNDFLTKPVNFVWLERKVMEWGCMQALIDFDGWRKWKDFSQQADGDKAKPSTATKKKKARSSLGSPPTGSTSRRAIQEQVEDGGS